MLFNSLDFAIFLPIVFGLYWFVFRNSIKLQNLLIVVASYVFYGWWDYRFLSLIIFSTLVDYTIGVQLSNVDDKFKRRALLWTSLIVNLGLLGFFKYYNFFIDNFTTAFSLLGHPISPNTLNIILPVGISFYTFQTLSYTIDVYKKHLEPTRDVVAFAAYVSFFPQLVAGPIERATNLLPQFYKKRTFDQHHAVDGLRQILWGLFKKVVIADNCAVYANQIFEGYADMSGTVLVLGALFFTFQIYGDFSGYSDIAIGTSRLFGFDLMQNFAFPYFSRDIAEFWRRWHISLSTWFRDYLYIPLGGSRGGTAMKVRNTFIIFLVSGFWHGANWTFIVWGFLNALYFMPLLLTNSNRNNLDIVAKDKFFPNARELWAMSSTFAITVFAWIFFRANNMPHALDYIKRMFSHIADKPVFDGKTGVMVTLLLIAVMVLVEWTFRQHKFALHTGFGVSKPVRWFLYVVIIVSLFMFAPIGSKIEFIYFQF